MGQVEIDDDLIKVLNGMKKEEETTSEVLRRVLVSLGNDVGPSREYVTEEEFKQKTDEILEKYHDLLLKLAE